MTYYDIKSILAVLGVLLSTGLFVWKLYQLLWDNMRRGQASGPFRDLGERLRGLLVFVAGQVRLFRFFPPGLAHFFIFWGFAILSLTILQAILEGLLAFQNPHFLLPLIGNFGPLALLQDFFAVFVLIAVTFALYTRIVVDPERYKASHKSQGVMVLLFIATIMITLLVLNGSRINLGEDSISVWRPISHFVGNLFAGSGENAQRIIGEIAYWIHLVVVLVFLTELPGGKHFHVVTSLPAVFLRNLAPLGQLPPAPEFNGDVGISKVEQFTWRQMLDFYTCTECGRCQDVCPAYSSGLSLSPKILMMSLRDNLIARGKALRAGSNGGNGSSILKQDLLGDVLSEEFIWACTTCLACDQECPLFIEHVVPLVDLRRFLVIEGRMDEMLQESLANLGRYGNSFGQSERARAKWTRGIEPEIRDIRKEEAEFLWFVGDYASYNTSCVEITRLTAHVFERIGLDFGILYDAERNAGNDVRRVGEEGLYEMLMEENQRAFSQATFEKIITTDPHSYNSLRHEYGFDGSDGPNVLHYTELLDDLIQRGQINFKRRLGYTVTYHDPCYLGRYNGIYQAPRRILEALGCKILEMERNRDTAYCCGAGGGRIWMDEGGMQERPSEARIHEAVRLERAQYFVVACPKDVTMYKDAVKTTGFEEQIEVKDLIELVSEAL